MCQDRKYKKREVLEHLRSKLCFFPHTMDIIDIYNLVERNRGGELIFLFKFDDLGYLLLGSFAKARGHPPLGWLASSNLKLKVMYCKLVASKSNLQYVNKNSPLLTILIHCGGVVLDSPGHFEK